MISMIDLDQARERREAQIREAALRRRVAASSPSIRQSIGRLMIRIGERVAAEKPTVAGPATLTPGRRPTHPEVPYDHRRP